MSESCQMIPSSFWLKFLNVLRDLFSVLFAWTLSMVCLFVVVQVHFGCTFGSGSSGEILLVWSLGISDEVSFKGWEGNFSKECSDPELDSLCESESERDPEPDSEFESESEMSPERSPLTTSFVGAEGCCKDSTKGAISAE